MAQQTAVEWLQERYNRRQVYEESIYDEEFEQAKAMEQQQIKDAVMYGLDEDGHTGDWKISVAHNYYNKTFTNENTGTKADY